MADRVGAVSAAYASVLLVLQAVAITSWRGPLLSRPASQPLGCNAQALASVLPLEAVVERVVVVPKGGSYGEGAEDEPCQSPI